MNKTQLVKNKGKQLKTRPIARRIDPTRGELTPIDYVWLVQGVTDDEMTLYDGATSHLFRLGLDHIKEYRTDPGGSGGFLMLKSQIILRGASLDVEPLP